MERSRSLDLANVGRERGFLGSDAEDIVLKVFTNADVIDGRDGISRSSHRLSLSARLSERKNVVQRTGAGRSGLKFLKT